MSICSGCSGGCCRAFAVPVSGADIIRLQRNKGLQFWEFVVRWADPTGNIAGKFAPQFFFEDEPETPFVICLKQTPSQMFPGSLKCPFLQEGPADAEHPLGVASCGAYADRPFTCRIFPMKFEDRGRLAILNTVPAHGRPSDPSPAYQLCPRPWQPDDVDPLQALQDLVVAEYEMQFFQQLARTWNQRPGAWESFPEFLQIVYSQRVLSPAAMTSLQAEQAQQKEAEAQATRQNTSQPQAAQISDNDSDSPVTIPFPSAGSPHFRAA